MLATLCIVIWSCFCWIYTSGSFSKEIQPVHVVVGHNATLSCQSDTPVTWKRQLFKSFTESEQICYEGKIVGGYENEFAINIDHSKQPPEYNLTVINADMDDAGEYKCIESGGLGDSVSANLTVYEVGTTVQSSSTTSTVDKSSSCAIRSGMALFVALILHVILQSWNVWL